MVKTFITTMVACLLFSSCELLSQMGLPLTPEDVANGLKEALVQGVNRGSGSLFAVEGNGNTSLLNQMLPENVRTVLGVAKNLGLSPKIDAVSSKLNAAAISSVQKSVPVFIAAIRQMSITDAWGILRGDKNAATNYLRKATTAGLMAAIRPEVNGVFASVGIKPSLLQNLGVKNPLLGDLDIDMSGLLTNMITSKMYDKIEIEESRIRTDIGARTTQLMQRVFAAATNSATPMGR